MKPLTLLAGALLLCGLAGVSTAQERAVTGSSKRVEQTTEGSEIKRGLNLRDNLQTVINTAAGPCNGHAYNSEWEETCESGFTGKVVKTCLQGQAIIKTRTCKRMTACNGGHAHGTEWNVNCPNNLTGTMRNRCFDGTAAAVSFNCR